MRERRKYTSEVRSHQIDQQPRPVNVGVVHFDKTIGVVVIGCEVGLSDAALGHGLHLHTRKHAHGRDDLAIRVGDFVFVLVDDAARPGFPALVTSLAADGERPFPSLSFFDGILDIREGIDLDDSKQAASHGMHPQIPFVLHNARIRGFP